MQVYSETIFAFLEHAHQICCQILRVECGLKVGRTRFAVGRTTYPINIVVFDNKNQLAYFDSYFLEMGLNHKLITHTDTDTLTNILRHEIAHYLAFIFYGTRHLAHGEEFKSICEKYGWPEEVSESTLNLEEVVLNPAIENIIEKVKKLMNLASSDNTHEAELALLKANQLLLRYHLGEIDIRATNEEKTYIETLFTQPKKTAKISAIYQIMHHFMVRPLLLCGRGMIKLEVIGGQAQVKLARYVAHFLDRELDSLWNHHKKTYNLKGLRAKNSFFIGVSRGFSEKLQSSRRELHLDERQALIVIETELEATMHRVFGRLSAGQSNRLTDFEAMGLGQVAGNNLNIRPGVEHVPSQTYALTHNP